MGPYRIWSVLCAVAQPVRCSKYWVCGRGAAIAFNSSATGEYHNYSQVWEYRDSQRTSARVISVNATEPSMAAVRRQLQPEGLQCEDAPLRTAAPGLCVHSGTAYARLHNDFEGIGKITFESMLQCKQRQARDAMDLISGLVCRIRSDRIGSGWVSSNWIGSK